VWQYQVNNGRAPFCYIPDNFSNKFYNGTMPEQNLFLSISNPLMKWLLRTPLHGLASKSTLLVSVTGVKTGRTITTPVNYLRDGAACLVISSRTRTWWRNLRGNRECSLRLRGEDVRCSADVFEADEEVAQQLARFVELNPNAAGYLGIQRADQSSLRQAAAGRVVVRFHLP
jgi:deazaflavin-dependent oxidoreductase (nitroreductase family)